MKCLRLVSAALVALAVAAPLALMVVVGLSPLGPQQASAQGTVNFDIDPEITGNSANTLGAVESCARCDVAGPDIGDGVADCFVDIVVWGDTQAPVSYDVSINYTDVIVTIAAPGTDPLIKMPGAADTGDTPPDDDGTFVCSARYFEGGPGIPGDGAICRLGLDAISHGMVTFTLDPPPLTAYESGAGTHPNTTHTAYLAINQDCLDPPIDLSVDSQVTSAPTDLVVGQDGTLSVTTTGTHTNAPFPYTVEVTISHTVTAPAGCTVDGGTSASDSWTGDLDGGASHDLATDFTINCSQSGYHQFAVYNQIQLLAGTYDPDLSNNTDTENVSVNVWLYLDTDEDGVLDHVDNCPGDYNPDQEDGDEDGWGDACDNCPTTPTPWYVPLGDDDCDGFTTAAEEQIGTDPLDNCPDDPSDDAWPLDINMDQYISVVGDALELRGHIGAEGGPPPDPNWDQRLDLSVDNYLSVVGDVLMYRGNAGEGCTNP